MECPICSVKFAAALIESHVEECLLNQDASLALQVQHDINKNGQSRQFNDTGPRLQPTESKQTRQIAAPIPPVSHHQPSSLNNSKIRNPIENQYLHASGVNQSLQFQHNPNVTPRQNSSAPPPKLTGATQADVDTYNMKIQNAHKCLQSLTSTLESFSERLNHIESRNQNQSINHNVNDGLYINNPIIHRVDIKPLPNPRYMALKPAPAQPSNSHRNNQPINQNYNPSIEQKQKFFQTYQRYSDDALSARATSFFQTGAVSSPQQSPTTGAHIRHYPSSPALPLPSNSKNVNQAPSKPQQSTQQSTQQSLAAQKPSSQLPKEHKAFPAAPKKEGITDLQLVQIESRWMANVIDYPDDAADLILGHLTMLFNQRIKKRNDRESCNQQSNLESDSKTDSKTDLPQIESSESQISKSTSNQPVNEDGLAHPLSEYVASMIETWNEPFARITEPSQETISKAASLVQGLITTLEDVVLDYYPFLSISHQKSAVNQAQYNQIVAREEITRKAVRMAIWPLFYEDLMPLIRSKCMAEDEVCNQKMKEYVTIHPGHLGVPQDYWLIEPMSLDGEPEEIKVKQSFKPKAEYFAQIKGSSSNQLLPSKSKQDVAPAPKRGVSPSSSSNTLYSTPPYYQSIQLLKDIGNMKDPDSKLDCLVRSAKALVEAVRVFHTSYGRDPSKYPVGGDELLPIFSYVVIRSGVKNLASESCFMELLISDDMARGEHGYILATLQTVIAFLSCLDNNLITQSVDSVFKKIIKEVKEEVKQEANQAKQEPKHEETMAGFPDAKSAESPTINSSFFDEDDSLCVIPPSESNPKTQDIPSSQLPAANGGPISVPSPQIPDDMEFNPRAFVASHT